MVIKEKYQSVSAKRKRSSLPEKLVQRCQRTNVLNQLTRPESVRHSQLPLLPVPLKIDPIRYWGTIEPVKTPSKNSLLFSAVVPTSTDEGRTSSTKFVKLAEPLSFPTADTDVAVLIKRTYKIDVEHHKSIKAIPTTVTVPVIRAGVNLEYFAPFTPEWENSAKKEPLPKLTTRENSRFKSKVLL